VAFLGSPRSAGNRPEGEGTVAKARFGGVSDAKLSERTETLVEGDYELKIRRCKWVDTRKKEEFFLAEFEVTESNNPKTPAGAIRKWMPIMGEDTSDAKLKGFAIACLGIEQGDAEKIEAASAELPGFFEASLDGPDAENVNALKDVLVRCEVTKRTAKGSGNEYRYYRFYPSPNQK